MVKSFSFRIPLAVLSAAVCSCATPKAIVVEENAPAMAAEEPKKEESAPEPVIAGPPDDGIRLPDMLTLPGENEFRKAPSSGGGRSSGSGAVIARPPSE